MFCSHVVLLSRIDPDVVELSSTTSGECGTLVDRKQKKGPSRFSLMNAIASSNQTVLQYPSNRSGVPFRK
ncbi:MAG: hypothetical protein WBB73_07855 [Candidatus Aminicenantaceae bacterium]